MFSVGLVRGKVVVLLSRKVGRRERKVIKEGVEVMRAETGTLNSEAYSSRGTHRRDTRAAW